MSKAIIIDWVAIEAVMVNGVIEYINASSIKVDIKTINEVITRNSLNKIVVLDTADKIIFFFLSL